MKKSYIVVLLDHSKPFEKKRVFFKHADGLKNARGLFPSVKVHYSKNGGCFIGCNGNYELIISEI